MWSTTIILTCYIATCLSSDFNLWDHCSMNSTDCILENGRYAYGSGYDSESESSSWYLVGGLSNILFVSYNNTAIINLPSSPGLTGYECASLYPQSSGDLSQSSAAVIDNILYNFGGFTGDTFVYSDDTISSDTSTESPFVNKANMPLARSAGCSVTVNGMVYILGGINDDTPPDGAYFNSLNSLIVYDPDENEFTTLATMNTARFAPGCAAYDDAIYVFGGQKTDLTELNTIEIYDIDNNEWTLSEETISYSAHWITATNLEVADFNLILVMGGISGLDTFFNNMDIYDIDQGTVIQTVEMPMARYAFGTITPYYDDWEGRHVLLAGGKNGDGAISSVDILRCESDTPEPGSAQRVGSCLFPFMLFLTLFL